LSARLSWGSAKTALRTRFLIVFCTVLGCF
jgi:hypothetical protein